MISIFSSRLFYLLLPTLIVFLAFFLIPMVQLVIVGGSGEEGVMAYLTFLTKARHFESMVATVLLSAVVTVVALVVSTIAGLFLVRNRFPGRETLVSLLTFPLAFPGVVIGFLIIMLAGRQGLIGSITKSLTGDKVVFAYSMAGLFLGYLYFSIPRVILTVMATAEKLDRSLEEAAKSLGANQWRVIVDVMLPALKPGLIASGAICFATSMGAFGTAFTLATNIDVLPMTIYTEFTLNANFAGAASLSIVLGLITWVALFIARSLSGSTVAASG
ncbi:ABC transporter permease subunit [Sneathiella sp. P13V-1]|uniref:ABC transporter permease n=1 Tax=Sneathiella sp. P13V-1 TaxID=2697366 RepID=UPI00187B7CA6|nr:ABC transporter permease [Sneathiella sp. P13V-1]MBE7636558.1 ABC transporter permease subunit [Sneathiella sp. P13V-1]